MNDKIKLRTFQAFLFGGLVTLAIIPVWMFLGVLIELFGGIAQALLVSIALLSTVGFFLLPPDRD